MMAVFGVVFQRDGGVSAVANGIGACADGPPGQLRPINVP
jgi:hypothetical protein